MRHPFLLFALMMSGSQAWASASANISITNIDAEIFNADGSVADVVFSGAPLSPLTAAATSTNGFGADSLLYTGSAPSFLPPGLTTGQTFVVTAQYNYTLQTDGQAFAPAPYRTVDVYNGGMFPKLLSPANEFALVQVGLAGPCCGSWAPGVNWNSSIQNYSAASAEVLTGTGSVTATETGYVGGLMAPIQVLIQAYAQGTQVSAVPEPGTFELLAVGLVVLGALQRRRGKA